jgi:hypothetical protein
MKEFTLTPEDLASLYEACKPVPYMVFNGIEPTSPQENANRAWQSLGEKYGFQWDTVQPCGKGDATFLAEPI